MQRNCNGMLMLCRRVVGLLLAAIALMYAAGSTAQVTFGSSTVADISLEVGQPLSSRTLPAAYGGVTPYTYSITPTIPSGFSFNATTRLLSGTPTQSSATRQYSYTVTDSSTGENNTATISFNILVISATKLRLDRTVATDTTITVDWWGMNVATSYCVKYKLITAATYSTCGTKVTPSEGQRQAKQTKTISGLVAGSSYSILIEAYNESNSLIESTSTTVSTAADATPVFPANASIASLSLRVGQASYSQTALPLATGGNGTISYSITPTLPTGMYLTEGRMISGTPTTAQSATTYSYRATDADGDYSSLTFTITIQAALPITGIKVTSGPDRLSVKWNAVSGADQYHVSYRVRGQTGAFTSFSSSSLTQRVITGLTSGTFYEIRIRASSQSVSLTTATTYGRPGSASNPTGFGMSIVAGDGVITVTWNAAVGAERYLIQYQEGSGASNFNAGSYVSTQPAGGYKIRNLKAGTQYRVRLQARGINNSLLISDSRLGTTTPDTAPSFGTQTITPNTIVLWLGKPHTPTTLPASGEGLGNAPLVYSISPALPSGLTFSASTRQISGTPTSSTISSIYTYSVADRDGETASLTFKLQFRSFFATTSSSTSIAESSRDFSAVNSILSRDRMVPSGSSTEDRVIAYTLDTNSDKTFSVSTGSAANKPPILGLDAGKSLDYESGTTSHAITIRASTTISGTTITLGTYLLNLTVLDVNEPPQKLNPPAANAPDEELFLVGASTRSFNVQNRFFDPEKRTVTLQDSSLIITNGEGTTTYASGTAANTLSNHLDQVVTANVINGVLVQVTIDTSRITVARTITNDVRIRAKDAGNLVSSDYYIIRFNVKIGANNAPEFIGGATALTFNIFENSNVIGTTYATDLDDSLRTSGKHNDKVQFSLQGARKQSFWPHPVLMLHGSCLYVETSRDTGNKRWTATIKSFTSTNPDGTVRCSAGFDYEKSVTPLFVLKATDGFGGEAAAFVTVTVQDVNEPPIKMLSKLTNFKLWVAEAEARNLATYVSDPEGQALTFVVTSSQPTVATAVESAGVVTVTGVGAGKVTIFVSYRDAGGHAGSFQMVAVVKTVGSNRLPDFSNGVAAVKFSIPENSPAGTKVGSRHIAIDADPHDVVTYSLSAHTDTFTLSSQKGHESQVLVKAGAKLDYESTNQYVFDLIADDGWGGQDKLQVTLDLTNANEPPYLNPSTTSGGRITAGLTMAAGEDAKFVISGHFKDVDSVDSGRLKYKVSIRDGSLATVRVDAQGTLHITNASRVGSTEILITASDSVGQSVLARVTLTIEGNTAPIVRNPLPDLTMNIAEFKDIDLTNVFYDAEDSISVESVSVVDESVLLGILTKNNTELTIFTRKEGSSDVTLTAVDGVGTKVSDTFTVTVQAASSTSLPHLASRIGDQTITAGDDFILDIADRFRSANGQNPVEILIESLDPTIAIGSADVSTMQLTLRGYEPGNVMMKVIAVGENQTRVGDLFTTYVETRPELVAQLPDIELEIGGGAINVDFAHVFVDRDGDPLTYRVDVLDTSFVSIEWTDTELTASPLSKGETRVIVSASDPKGRTAELSFGLTVRNDGLRLAAEKSLANYGRTLLSGVTDAVGRRVSMDTKSSDLTVSEWLENLAQQRAGASPVDQVEMSAQNRGTATAIGLLPNAGFEMSSQPSFALGFGGEQSNWAVWGHTDRQRLKADAFEVESSAHYYGVDFSPADRWLVGVAVAQSQATSDFAYGTAEREMQIDTDLVVPYVSYEWRTGTRLWSMVGIGRGDIDVIGPQDTQRAPVNARMWLVGGKQNLFAYRNVQFTARADYAALALTTANDNLGMQLGTEIDRIRAGIEAQSSFDFSWGTISPSIDVGIRQDAGFNPLGTGLEVATGLLWEHSTFSLEAKGRTVQQPNTTSQNSVTMTFELKPNLDGSGLAMKVQPRWGASDLTNNLTFGNHQNIVGMSSLSEGIDSDRAVSVEIGYGKRVLRDAYLIQPFFMYDNAANRFDQYLVGTRFERDLSPNQALHLEFSAGMSSDKKTKSAGGVFNVRARINL